MTKTVCYEVPMAKQTKKGKHVVDKRLQMAGAAQLTAVCPSPSIRQIPFVPAHFDPLLLYISQAVLFRHVKIVLVADPEPW